MDFRSRGDELRVAYAVWFKFLFHHEEHEGHEGGRSEDVSLHPVFEFGDSKVEDESDSNARKFPIGEDWSLMDRIHSLLRQR